MLKKMSYLSVAALLVLGVGCSTAAKKWTSDMEAKDTEIAAVQEERRAVKADLEACEENLKVATRKIEDLNGSIAALTAELDKCKGSRFTMTIEADVLFKPGSNVLSSEGKKILSEAAATIKDKYPDSYITVEGHTDTDPISATKNKWKDNWDLGSGRGNAVLRYLASEGVDETKLASMSYSYHQPVSDSDKSKNRRAVIVVNSGWPRF
jgi:flagellar motor protein MotB